MRQFSGAQLFIRESGLLIYSHCVRAGPRLDASGSCGFRTRSTALVVRSVLIACGIAAAPAQPAVDSGPPLLYLCIGRISPSHVIVT